MTAPTPQCWRDKSDSAGLNWLSKLPQTTLHTNSPLIFLLLCALLRRRNAITCSSPCVITVIYAGKNTEHLCYNDSPQNSFPTSITDAGVWSPVFWITDYQTCTSVRAVPLFSLCFIKSTSIY